MKLSFRVVAALVSASRAFAERGHRARRFDDTDAFFRLGQGEDTIQHLTWRNWEPDLSLRPQGNDSPGHLLSTCEITNEQFTKNTCFPWLFGAIAFTCRPTNRCPDLNRVVGRRRLVWCGQLHC